MSSYAKRMQDIVREYQGAGKPWPASVKEMAAWAIETNKWKVHRSTEIQACARDLARALREEYYTDQQVGACVLSTLSVSVETIHNWFFGMIFGRLRGPTWILPSSSAALKSLGTVAN